MRRRILVVLFMALAAWGLPAARSHADTSPYLNVWVHYDYMVGPGYSDAPSASAIQLVIAAFKAHGVTLHIDPLHTPIPGHAVIVPDWQSEYASAPGFDNSSCTGPDAVRFSALKARYFHPASKHPWHYAVFGNLVFGDTSAHLANCPATIKNGNAPPLYGMTGDSMPHPLPAQSTGIKTETRPRRVLLPISTATTLAEYDGRS